MIRSMTGFGAAAFETGGVRFNVEIRSVNHRHCDVRVRVPRRFAEIEAKLVAQVQQAVSRGKIDVTISAADGGEAPQVLELNAPLAEQYFAMLEQLRQKFGIKEPIRLESFIALRDVVFWKEPEISAEAFARDASRALAAALDELLAMRAQEGTVLTRDLAERLSSIEAANGWIGERMEGVGDRIRASLREKVKALLDGAEPDPWRMEQEVLFHAERMDTSEELTRLGSHIAQFRHLLDAEEGAVGRKMDFLVQEMMRETNTINAKANDAELVHRVVEIKAELEKIREQIQNVE